ncbi:MAG: HEAT repeat domain-containing protein, partial [Armatimonadota bacterium]|nr:HEAT repeat domain-containing protein [Armatimonadota bacterium]
ILDATKNNDPAVRQAAIAAAGQFESPEAAKALVALLDNPDEAVRRAAQQSLQTLPGTAANAALAESLRSASNAARIALLNILAARAATGEVKSMLPYIEDQDSGVRTAAWTTLGALADEHVLPTLVKGLLKTPEEERDAAIKALLSAARGSGNVNERAAPLVAALRGADPAMRGALLRVLGQIGGSAALGAVRTAVQDTATADDAVRALVKWPNAEAVPALLEVARSATKPTHRILALRGLPRLIGMQNASPEEKLRLYQQALELAPRPEDKKLMLGALADQKTGVHTLSAMQTLLPLLNSSAVQEEAALAATNIAARVMDTASEQEAEQVKSALQKVLAASKSEAVRQQANALLQGNVGENAPRRWLVLGPFPNDFDKAFEPETSIDRSKSYSVTGGKTARWKVTTAEDNGYVNLLPQFQPNENVSAYAALWVKSPTARKAVLSTGSDDGAKVWLNGQVALSKNVPRGAQPGEDQLPVELKEGWNQVLFKITQGGGDWGFYFDLLDQKKQPMTDLLYSTRPAK